MPGVHRLIQNDFKHQIWRVDRSIWDVWQYSEYASGLVFCSENDNHFLVTRTCAYLGIGNVGFSENFAFVLNEWTHNIFQLRFSLHYVKQRTEVTNDYNFCWSVWIPVNSITPSVVKMVKTHVEVLQHLMQEFLRMFEILWTVGFRGLNTKVRWKQKSVPSLP